MAERSRSHRRDFLAGKSAAQALADLADGAQATSDAAAPTGSQPYQLRFSRRAMACEFEVILNAGQYPQGGAAAIAALDLVDRLEEQLTVYRETSELMEINRDASQRPVQVEPRLFQLLRRALELWRQTQGAFDITAGPLSKVWGFHGRQGVVPEAADLQHALERVGSQHVSLDEEAQSVRFHVHGMELNLGAIGKGYALDRTAELLLEEGVHDFLIHGGQSSVLARGSSADAPADRPGWVVAVIDPLRPARRLAEVRLLGRALGTSGSGTQFFVDRGRRFGHILDPRTGCPAEGVLSATVVAPTAAEADALATSFYILGVGAATEYCRRNPELGAVLVTRVAGSDQVEIHKLGSPDLLFA